MWTEVLRGPHPAIVVFHGDGYGHPCRLLAPLIDRVTKAYPDVRVVELDVNAHRDLAAEFLVEEVPTTVIFNEGRPIARQDGFPGEERAYEWLTEQLNALGPRGG